MKQSVKAWREQVTIPTYGIGEPEKNPIFLEKRVYQGSSGVVYPYPVIEKIFDEKKDEVWNAIYLENEYLKIMILPELGGRIQMAYDKVKQRHFVYYNQVIKPALVGLTGPWISGGIEFNWPQHHRPTTYDPVDSSIEENKDGSITVWCSEVERMFRTKAMAGFTLHPDKAYLEIKAKIYNRTPFPQTFLWWANPAVKVNDDYQSVFPPDVNAVFDHGKRDVSSFPIATGTYYKVDYSAGVDISRYKNIPVPTSYMAIKSDYDFVGGYENDTKGGLLHIADHHQSPGKKQWTWGNGDFGQAWDRNLTDEDGPYIELMCGVYTDNQPDFTWLQPYEEKSFKQYFMPYRDLGVVKNATKEALVNLEFENNSVNIKAYATARQSGAKIYLYEKDTLVMQDEVELSPYNSYEKTCAGINNPKDCYIKVCDINDSILVDWKVAEDIDETIPEPAKAALEPSEIENTEQLYLQGLHLEQYRHATFNPIDYYEEALRRDPSDIRNNNALGLWFMRKGQFSKAEKYFRTAITTLTERNPNPYESEPLYNLGLCLSYQDKQEEAYELFQKAAWSGAWQDSSYFNAAKIATKRKDFERALDLTDRALSRNAFNQKARHLRIILNRMTNNHEEALEWINNTLAIDQFNFGALYEKYLLTADPTDIDEFKSLIRDNVHNYIEYALDYAEVGLNEEAHALLNIHMERKDSCYPIIWYLKGYLYHKQGKTDKALEAFKIAGKQPADYCFPNKVEELIILQQATMLNPQDAKAWYYLGNFWYGARQYKEAIQCWEQSRGLDSTYPTVHRNLSLAYYNKCNDSQQAREALEKAFELDSSDARVLMELDQLYKKLGVSADERTILLEQHPELVDYRDDLYLELLSLKNFQQQEDEALKMLMNRRFHPWEGGEGKVVGQYLHARIELAKKAIENSNFEEALEHLKATNTYPENLGEGKLTGAQENDVYYWMGCTFEAMGRTNEAKQAWEHAASGLTEPSVALYYNDQQPDKIFYQALALQKLNRNEEAKTRFTTLQEYGERELKIPFKMDYFAVSLPDLLIFEEDLQKRHEKNCRYLMALGNLGLGNIEQAHELFKGILEEDPYFIGASIHCGIKN
ncbi:DUF5107 domain-containing protein [Puteibacter caeruleilacunae]|nr:DUF5107 domain-containing protein [Puteibacter caeruleilacunae]